MTIYSCAATQGKYLETEVFYTHSSAKYSKTEDDYVELFYKYLKQWRLETLLLSSGTEILENKLFKKIVDLGEKIIPHIIEEIRYNPDHLIVALHLITGENPLKDSDQGNFVAMADSWIDWYDNNK